MPYLLIILNILALFLLIGFTIIISIKYKNSEKTYKFLFNDIVNQQKDEVNQKTEEMFKKLEEREEKFSEQNLKKIDLTLKPFKENLSELKEQINNNNIEQAKQSEIFKAQVESMVKVTENMQDDANNLATALKGDSKMQGDWGETILSRTLEASGLKKGKEYKIQESYEDIAGSRKVPDAVIYLPGDRHIVIDSKVSMRAYLDYVNTDDPKEKEQYLKKLISDIKDRIKELKSKDYASLPDINSADYVLIFFPIEAAFNLVVSEDWEFQILSSEDRIIFTTPTNLMAVLRMAENLWRIDHQNKNAEKIAIKAGNLVDKFSGLLGDFEQLGKNIKSVEKSYEGARKKLDTGTGNIFNRIQELEDLGAKSKKTLKKSNRLQIENSEN
tara:strand:- start:68 stop:1225 length:1158 start_codon:yes stop_codon:yes gene_type:complete